MTIKKIATLIQDKYHFIDKPSQEEIELIFSKIHEDTTQNEFDEIVLNSIKNTLAYSNESIDMSASIDILQQIKAYLRNS